MKKGSILFISALITSFLTVSCGTEDDQTTVDIPVDTIQTETKEHQVYYQIPTPNEFFSVIKEVGGSARPELMNPVANADKYYDTRYKALNFGVYSSDLAYASSYEIGKAAIEYFAAIEKMGNELDITAAFDQSVYDRIDQNLSNGDSLVSISNESYFDAYNYLEENDRGNVLSLVVAGGWVESMWIVMNLAGNYSDDNALIQRIAQQKLTLDNLLGFMGKYSDDSAVGTTIADLEEVQMIYETLDVVEAEISTESNNGVLTFSGNGEYKFNKDNYADLFAKIKDLRTKYTTVQTPS